MITKNLDMGMEFVGMNQSIMMAGGIVGGIIASTIGARFTIKAAPLLLFAGSITVIPMGVTFLFGASTVVSYIIITGYIL